MDTSVAKQMINAIRQEQQRRARSAVQLASEDPNLAGEQWVFTDGPFINELCLMLLVAVWHQVEREVIWLAAAVTDDGKQISRDQYLKNAQEAQNNSRKKIVEKLRFEVDPIGWTKKRPSLDGVAAG
jgi:hypothetical protein